MVSSIARSTASGSTANFSVPFPYLDKTHTKVSVAGVLLAANQYTWLSDGEVQLVAGAPSVGTVVERRRQTPDGPLTNFQPGNLDSADLNVGVLQPLYKAQEATDQAADILARGWFTKNFQAGGTIEVGAAGDTLVWDAEGNVTFGPNVNTLEGYMDAALAAAATATAQAGIATTGATTATTQAGIATTQGGIATTQANSATASAALAQEFATKAEDQPITGFPALRSALHYAAKAASYIATNIGAAINAFGSKATLVDADKFVVADSAAAWLGKNITLAQMKTNLELGFNQRLGKQQAGGTYDWDTLLDSGWYFAVDGSANAPAAGSFYAMVIQQAIAGPTNLANIQFAFEANGPRVYRRHRWYTGSTWQSWVEITASGLGALPFVQGDIPYYSGTKIPARLPKGTAGAVLTQNDAVTAPGWAQPDMKFLGTFSATNAASLSISLAAFIADGYEVFDMVVSRAHPATTGSALHMTVSLNNGSSYIATGYNYAGVAANSSGSNALSSQSAANAVAFALTNDSENTSTGAVRGNIRFVCNGTMFQFDESVGWFSGSFVCNLAANGYIVTASAVNNIRLAASAGNITADINLYGRKRQ
ncbi:phage tail fiber domain-containing protein [Aminobacter sp. HY435]|uniref:phage tail fiber domain-containing protein n=1 Tax=Aminobacter sp. HY435 TaxID=2970917 RepID=UPI0022B99CAA|nr:phage tail fiber protein [Aminobacter sp. HY435]